MIKVDKHELRRKLCKKRGSYTPYLVDILCQDLDDLGWILLDKAVLKQELSLLETRIGEDVSTSPVIWIKRFQEKVLN